MYDFIDIDESNFERLPSEALLLDGYSIEERITGYKTLSVSGRELIGKEILSESRSGGDGDLFISSKYPARVITVRYKLEAENNQLFRIYYEELNKFLNGEQKEIRFADDLAHSFYGTLSDVSEVSEGLNTVTGSFSFYCSDPFKYKDEVMTSGKSVSVAFDDNFKLLPRKIVVIPSVATPTITLKTNGKQIRLTQGSFVAGQRITFDFYTQEIYTLNANYMNKLDLASEFEDFYLTNNSPVTLTEAGTMELYFREVAL